MRLTLRNSTRPMRTSSPPEKRSVCSGISVDDVAVDRDLRSSEPDHVGVELLAGRAVFSASIWLALGFENR